MLFQASNVKFYGDTVFCQIEAVSPDLVPEILLKIDLYNSSLIPLS